MKIKTFRQTYKDFTGISINDALEDQDIEDEVLENEQYYMLGQLSVLEALKDDIYNETFRDYTVLKLFQ